MTAFTVSGIAGTVAGILGEPYRDASGVTYLPMIVQPILVYKADAGKLRTVCTCARSRGLDFSVFTEALFATPDDEANCAAVAASRATGCRSSVWPRRTRGYRQGF